MKIQFTKLVANGNDFVAVDNRSYCFMGQESELAKHLCDRRFGIGADGLLMLEHDGELKMRIFNPDGSEAFMCGNGARCFAKYVSLLGLANNEIVFLTKAGVQTVIENGDSSKLLVSGITFDSSFSDEVRDQLRLEQIDDCAPLGFMRVGVPHCVIQVGECRTVDIKKYGPIIRYAKIFQPEGTNVIFCQKLSESRLIVRAWEKGVEAETFGCGTGAIASCYLQQSNLSFPVTVSMPGGNMIVERDGEQFSFSGDVRVSFEGAIDFHSGQ